jgi:hypothetical protein
MKRTFFFILLGILGLFIIYESQTFLSEPFQNSSPSVNIPKITPNVQPIQQGDPQPFTPLSTALLSPPPGQTASVNSYPVKDPARRPAPLKRIKGVYETIKGFVKNEMGGLEHSGDPAIKLPLESLKADYRRLEDETFVLTKNPGVESTLTEDDVKGIEANLRYLQKKWRLSGNSAGVEGFQGWYNQGVVDPTAIPPVETTSGNNFGLFPEPSMPGVNNSSSGTPATMSELNDLNLKIGAEIGRLSVSGTTDPLIKRRIDKLAEIQAAVSTITANVTSGQLSEAQIPILQSDYKAFLPIMSNVDSNLPDLISTTGANTALNNLFPMYNSGDISGVDLARSIFDKYAGDIMKNISWNLNLNYTGEAESKAAETIAKSIATSSTTHKTSRGDHETGPYSKAPNTEYRGMFDSIINNQHASKKEKDPSEWGPPAKLDWKKRAADICEQAARRGLNQYEFGCMKDTSAVSETFSFRGYTKMICNRLSTNYDPGVPELCGCPPPTWSGWRG